MVALNERSGCPLIYTTGRPLALHVVTGAGRCVIPKWNAEVMLELDARCLRFVRACYFVTVIWTSLRYLTGWPLRVAGR